MNLRKDGTKHHCITTWLHPKTLIEKIGLKSDDEKQGKNEINKTPVYNKLYRISGVERSHGNSSAPGTVFATLHFLRNLRMGKGVPCK